MTKLAYGSTKFSFNKNGDYKWEYTPTIGVSGKFSVDEKKQIIKLNDQNSLGETITDEFSYEIKNGQLEITIGFSEQPGKYVLEKM